MLENCALGSLGLLVSELLPGWPRYSAPLWEPGAFELCSARSLELLVRMTLLPKLPPGWLQLAAPLWVPIVLTFCAPGPLLRPGWLPLSAPLWALGALEFETPCSLELLASFSDPLALKNCRMSTCLSLAASRLGAWFLLVRTPPQLGSPLLPPSSPQPPPPPPLLKAWRFPELVSGRAHPAVPLPLLLSGVCPLWSLAWDTAREVSLSELPGVEATAPSCACRRP